MQTGIVMFLHILRLLVFDSRPCQSVLIQHAIMFVSYKWSLGWWFQSVTYVYSANKIDRHDKPQVLLKVALNTQHIWTYDILNVYAIVLLDKLYVDSAHCFKWDSYKIITSYNYYEASPIYTLRCGNETKPALGCILLKYV